MKFLKLTTLIDRGGLDLNQIVSDDELKETLETSGAVMTFIRYANGQDGLFNFGLEKREMVVFVLERLGIDTSKPFFVNGIEFNTYEYGYLEMSGVLDPNYAVLPIYKMKQVFDSYGLNFDWKDTNNS